MSNNVVASPRQPEHVAVIGKVKGGWHAEVQIYDPDGVMDRVAQVLSRRSFDASTEEDLRSELSTWFTELGVAMPVPFQLERGEPLSPEEKARRIAAADAYVLDRPISEYPELKGAVFPWPAETED